MNRHIINGHYMFGNTFIQPEMPMYEKIPHHNMAPVERPMPPRPGVGKPPHPNMNPARPIPPHPGTVPPKRPKHPHFGTMPPYPDMENRPICCPDGKPGCCLGYEDSANKIDTPYDDSAYDENNCECEDCPFASDGIIRDPLMFNVVNIETSIVKTLKVTLYGTSVDQDKTVNMKVGSRYAVTYITEHGLITSVGRLELISESVPDTCTRYINATNMAAASTAYIGMDCSTEGSSDKRKIYIATIRYIQELEDGEEVETEEMKSLRQRLQELLDAIENGELVFCNCDDCSKDTDGSDDTESDPADGDTGGSTEDNSDDESTEGETSDDGSNESTEENTPDDGNTDGSTEDETSDDSSNESTEENTSDDGNTDGSTEGDADETTEEDSDVSTDESENTSTTDDNNENTEHTDNELVSDSDNNSTDGANEAV